MGVACFATAAACEAATPQPVRLPLSLASLGTGPEVAYHPHRWLTIRRTIPFAQPGIAREESGATRIAPLHQTEALTGEVHPFGDGLHLALGFRQEKNRRLLRMNGDAADTGTARYQPMVALGVAGEVAPGLSFGADMAFLGRAFSYAGGVQLVTPVDQAQRRRGDAVRPQIRLSAGYRF